MHAKGIRARFGQGIWLFALLAVNLAIPVYQADGQRAFHPVVVSALTNDEVITLTLTGTVPGTTYLVLGRTNDLRSHWRILRSIMGSEATNRYVLRMDRYGKESPSDGGRSRAKLYRPNPPPATWFFAAGSGEDADGDGLPDFYEDLVTRTDPLNPDMGNTATMDGTRDQDGDGISNMEEMYRYSDPLHWEQPPAPDGVQVVQAPGETSPRILWQASYGTVIHYEVSRKPASSPDGEFKTVARVPHLGVNRQVTYVDTEANQVSNPVYRVRAVHDPTMRTLRAGSTSDVDGVRQSMRPVREVSLGQDNRKNIEVAQTVPRALYLLLSRQGAKDYWKANGYFTGSANNTTTSLQLDSSGFLKVPNPAMIHLDRPAAPAAEGQTEFIAGPGDDGDGDGLPDVYEVLVTGTLPDRAETRSAGTLDGANDSDGDGWPDLFEFRARSDPTRKESFQPYLVRVPAADPARKGPPRFHLVPWHESNNLPYIHRFERKKATEPDSAFVTIQPYGAAPGGFIDPSPPVDGEIVYRITPVMPESKPIRLHRGP